MKPEKEIREQIQVKLNKYNAGQLRYVDIVYELQEFCKKLQLQSLIQNDVIGRIELLVEFAKFIQHKKNNGLDFDCVQRGVGDFLKQLNSENDSDTKHVLGAVYTEEEVERFLITQRGNCYVSILSATRNQELAELASKAPEPWGWRK